MLIDIIENVQLAVMNGWFAVSDMVCPNPEVREVIREGNRKVNISKHNFAMLRRLLKEEMKQLDATHVEERKLLAEKQSKEKAGLAAQHQQAVNLATVAVRETRAKVISDISNARSNKLPAPSPA